MANYFDQFDAQQPEQPASSNYFDQFDGKNDPGFVSTIKRTAGQMAESSARSAEDLFGKNPITQGIQDWGKGVEAANPAGIGSLADIVEKPWLTVKEGVGNMLAQMPVTLAAGGAGQVIGGALGAPFGPAGIAAGQFLGRWGGAIAPTFMQEYGGIRKEQDEQGIDDKGRAAMAAIPATALEFNPLSPDVGMIKLLGKEAGKELFSKSGKEIAKDLGKAALKGAIGEGPLEEAPQTLLEAWGAYKDPLSKETLEEAAVSSILAAIGGGAMGPVTATMSGLKYARAQQEKADAEKAAADEQANNPPIAGLLPAPTYGGTPSDQLLQADAERQNAVDAAQKNADAIYAERAAFEEAMKSVYPYGPPKVVADVNGLQQQVDELLGIDQKKLVGIQRTHYVNALTKLLNEPIGIGHDENGLERPVTMGEYLDNQVKAEQIAKARQAPRDAANASAQSRLDQLATEENPMNTPAIPVVGPLSAAANTAVSTGAVAQEQVKQAMAVTAEAAGNQNTVKKNTAPKSANPMTAAAQETATTSQAPSIQAQAPNIEGMNNAAQAQKVAQETPQANDAQARPAAAPQAAPAAEGTGTGGTAQGIDLAGRTESQLHWLSGHGINGFKEAAIAELQKRGIEIASPQADETTQSPERPNGDGITSTPEVAPGQSAQQSNQGAENVQAQAEVLTQPGAVKDAAPDVSLTNEGDTKQGTEQKAEKQKGPEAPTFWTSSTPAHRKWIMDASGLRQYTAITPWNRIKPEHQAQLMEQWADKTADQNPIKNEVPVTTPPAVETAKQDQEPIKNQSEQPLDMVDAEEFERKMRSEAHADRSAEDDIQTTGLRFVPFDMALAIAKDAVASGVRPVPAQFHTRLDVTMDSADRLIAALSRPKTDMTPEVKQEQAPAIDADTRFAENTIFTADKVAAAKARMKAKLGTMNSGIDPELLIDGMTIAGAYIESGVRKFADYAKAMVDDLGDEVKPYLLSFYEAARAYPGLNKMGMDSAESAASQHQSMLTPEVKEAAKEVIGVMPTVEKKKPANLGEAIRLKQDWGVQNIDGYTRSKTGKNQQTDYGLKGGVKDEFMADATRYLKAVEKQLQALGYTAHLDRKGKPGKAVNANEGGPAVSGDVGLTMRKGDYGIYATVGVSCIRGIGPSHPQGVSLMVRVTPNAETDRYATKGMNHWLSVDLSAGDLVAWFEKGEAKTPAKIETPAESPKLEVKENSNANAEPASTGKDGDGISQVREAGNVSTPVEQQGTDQRGNEPGRSGDGIVQRPDGPVVRGSQSDEQSGEGTPSNRSDAISVDAGEPDSRNGAGSNARISERNAGGRDYLAPAGALTRTGSWLDTAKRNIEIIKLVKRLDAEEKMATPEEQALIAQYVGFGASELANGLFPPEYEYVRLPGRGYQTKKVATGKVDESALKPGWKEVYFDLKNSVTEEDMKAIMASTQFAHFTSESVIRSIWNAVSRFGFNGGRIVEPGMGTGLFMVAAPEKVANTSRYVGIERDNVTAAIAKQLLQGQSVIRNSFIDQNLPDNNFDLGIGNPPFAGWKVTADPRYKKQGFLLHDYFFAKTIDKVRPGGLLVFVTSKGTMDKVDDKARAYLSARADLLGAIRMPQTAFKGNAGTEVVTDVLFLRKREEGEAPSATAWAGLKEVETPQGPTKVNEYFADHPEMVLGKHEMVGSMYGPNQYTVTPMEGNIEEHFAKAIESLPKDIYKKAVAVKQGAVKGIQQKSDRQEFNVSGKKEGGLYQAEDGELMQVVNGVGVPLSNMMALNDKERAWLKDYLPLRDKLKKAMLDQLEDGDWEKSLADLKKSYAAFKKTHGRILEHTTYEREFENDAGDKETRVYKRFKWKKLLGSNVDIETTLVQGLEATNENDSNVVDGGILVNGRVLSRRGEAEIKTVNDAFAVTLNSLGRLDIPRIAELMNLTEEDAIQQLGELVYEHPVEGWQTADEYLSGDVLKKLEEAEVAAATDPKYERNVQALIKVQPAPLGPDRIVIRLGANWIPASDVTKFANEALDANTGVSYEPRTNRWTVIGENLRSERVAGSEWGTADRSVAEILSSVLNNESITIRRTTEDKKTYVDKDATAKANDIAEKMRQRFANWVWTDAERTENLLNIYNRKFNNLAPRAFDGSHLTLPGLSLRYKLYDHQLRAIWRVVQTGNTYLDHAVGAGKTLEMIVSSMEQKRLGLMSKPMFVVPNHMLEQFANEFQEAYPAARILVADKENFIGDQRRRFVAKAAMNDWDAVIIKQSSFGLIGIKKETAEAVADDMLDELKSALDDTDKQDRTTRKKIEAQIESVKQRVDSMVGKGDGNITFEELGVDFLYVDEAHTYRKLDYATNRQIKGIDPNGSKGAFGMFAKMRYLDQQRPGRSAVMASGTPVTNTIAELYTIQRFLDYEGLRQDGLHAFDAWANNFGAIGAEWERNAAGEFEKVERFSKFVNVPELMQRVRKFMDVLTMDQLGNYVKRPNLKGGQPEMITAEKSDALERYMNEQLLPRLEDSKKWKPTKDQPYNPDPVIAIGTDGRLAAIDARFAYPSMKDDKGSKLNLMIDNIIAEYKATAKNEYTTDGKVDKVKGGAQIVFSSVGFGANVEANRGFSPRKWMLERLKKAGIPSAEVAFMSDYTTDKQKETMFKEMREGKKRILVGSPANMGTGVNVQKRLTSLHFMAPPWYPADVEQPHGRILRQGNQNTEISIKWYVTAGTYDSTMWGMVRRKGAAIEQAFRGDGARTIEDISEVSSYAMAEAVAAGDDRVIKLAEAQANVEKYQRLKNSHFSEQQILRGNIASLDAQARSNRSQIIEYEKAKAAQVEAGYTYWKDLPVEVGGQTFSKAKETGEALLSKIAKVFSSGKTETIGTVQGKFPLIARIKSGEANYSKKDEVNVVLKVEPVELDVSAKWTLQEWADQDETGLGQRVSNAMRRVDETINMANRELTRIEGELTKKRPLLGAPFADESTLAQAIADAATIQAELVGESIKKQQAKADATKAAEQGGETAAGNVSGVGSMSQADKAIYGMAVEGKNAADILKFISQASRSPMNRQLAKLLLKTGIAPSITVGDGKGWKFNAGEGNKYAAGYNPKTDTVALFRPASAERNMLHELMHAATLKALAKHGMASGQMKSLYNHVKATKKLAGMYGMADVDEFVAEAFTNPAFQQKLKGIGAPKHAGTLKSAWHWFVRIVRGILGIQANQENALSQALEIGVGVMRENMKANETGNGVRYATGPKQTDTESFRKWFGDSKAVDAGGNPLVVYHGTGESFSQFYRGEGGAMWFTSNPDLANAHAARRTEGGNVMPAYLSIINPVVVDIKNGGDISAAVNRAYKNGNDGVIAKNHNDLGKYLGDTYIVFDSAKIKSAIGNNGNFDAGNNDIRYNLTEQASNKIADLLHSDNTFNFLHKSVSTQYHKATVDSDFKRVFDIGQKYLLDVSRFSMDAADKSPSLLAKLGSLADVFRKGPKREDIEAIAGPVFNGTLSNVVYSDAQLRGEFNLTDKQIALYREFRAGINKSLDDLGVSEMARISKSLLPADVIEQAKVSTLDEAATLLHESLLADMQEKVAAASIHRAAGDETTANALEEKALLSEKTAGDVMDKAGRIHQLKAQGYAPLMRFGQYAVDVVGQNEETGETERLYFGMYETQREANEAARALAKEFPGADISKGPMDTESYKMFNGIDPSSLEVFAEAVGADESAVFQDFLRLTQNNRSALKRLIKREGIEGFSKDTQRVLAQFVTSNGRLAAKNYHFGDMKKAVMDIPKIKGDVRNEAAKLVDYLQNPKEEAAPLRGYLFVHYLGGSIASALVNMTQPITMTAPYLAQFGGAAKAGAALANAAKLYASGQYDPQLADAMKLAEREGITAPHEIHQLYAESMRGLGRNMAIRKGLRVWGSFFSLAESFNRHLTFLAAYNMARDNGEANPFAFAQKAVEDTQGIYNKGNRPDWARGSIGATVFTFKQFSIAYIEFLRRLQKNNPQAFALALAIMFIGAGAEGLPFAEDIEDLIDTIGQFFGYSTNSKQWLRKNAAEVLGKTGGDMFRKGVSGIPGMPLDISSRIGVQNLIPGSALFKVSETNKARDVLEFIGPIGGFADSAIKGFDAARTGDVAGATRLAAPLAMQNVMKSADMVHYGFYRDQGGRKVVDTDGYDAFIKGIGFNPNVVARESVKIREQQQNINLQRAIEKEVADKWASGIFERDPAKVKQAQEDLREWNLKNPESRIAITPSQISTRIKAMTSTREQRFIKSAPKEIRGEVSKELKS